MIESLFHILGRKKELTPEDLRDWSAAARWSAVGTLGRRLIRGLVLKARLGSSGGMVLCDRNVRIYHPRYLSVGPGFSVEEGVEIVGVSRRGLVFGSNCSVKRFAVIHPSNVLIGKAGEGLVMGDHSNIGAFSFIGCSGFISIGSHVMMGPRVTLLAESHVMDLVDLPMKHQGIQRSFITIEDDCWIGASSTILPGVTVGTGSVIAAGAVVSRDVPPRTVVGGVPARVLRERGTPRS